MTAPTDRPRASPGAPRFLPLGDTGLVVEFGDDEISDAANAAVLALRAAIETHPPAGLRETVPTYRSLLVVYDPLVTPVRDLRAAVRDRLAASDPARLPDGRLLKIPTAYGGAYGPDLAGVAAETGLTESQVVAAHTGAVYRVYMIGFTPGFPYMGTLPPPIRVPRLASPRTRVPVRSVAMAGQQTGIYPTDSPGGWRLIGRTPLRIYDPWRANPFLLDAGDRVRYVPISAAEYERRAPADGEAAPPPPVPSRADFLVEDGGVLTTVQDFGRPGYRRFGMPQAGAMDPLALRIANLLLGNPPGAPALEFAFPGPRLVALRPMTIAIGGADLGPMRNGRPLRTWRATPLAAGDVLSFAAPRGGRWAYLAIPGGVDVPAVLGSRATYVRGGLGGYGGRRLRRGDRLAAAERAAATRLALRGSAPPAGTEAEVRLALGPQDDYFTADAVRALLTGAYRPGHDVDRVGYRLDGPRLAHRARSELLSDGLLPGAIQVPADGRPIVIMPDGPTAGGYPKIGAVLAPDLRLVAQASRTTPIRFRAVPWDEARRAAQDEAAALASLRFERAGSEP
jgi:KipI family sensor histidine kinase inhibitor